MKIKMFYEADPLLFERAKHVRNHLTAAEMKLWDYLRTKPFGYKFRRQHPIGIYIVDFYCHPLKLVIEADGNIHEIASVQQDDQERQRTLETEGLHVIRFTNTEILKEREIVIDKINSFLRQNSIPPSGGEGV
jgi:cyclase